MRSLLTLPFLLSSPKGICCCGRFISNQIRKTQPRHSFILNTTHERSHSPTPDLRRILPRRRFRHSRRRGSQRNRLTPGRRSLPPPLAWPQTRPPQAHQRGLAEVGPTRSQKGPRHPLQPAQAADRSRPRSPNIGSSKISRAGNRYLPPRHHASPRHPPPAPQNHARDRLRSSTISATAPTSAPRSRATSTTSKPSTSPPTTPPATLRTPSSSPTSPPSPAANASSCAPTPARFRSAP